LRLPNAPPHNLRLALTSFVGRTKALGEIKRLLATTRLLTLTGVGGSGKTRLALQVASAVLSPPEEQPANVHFADGVWWVDLVPLRDPALVVQAVATVLQVREQPGRSLKETLVEFLRTKQTLLVFDNCEHLVDACAELGGALLRRCPDVRILATSREPLKIERETAWSPPPFCYRRRTFHQAGIGIPMSHAQRQYAFSPSVRRWHSPRLN
jgi:non-specific serine/threonine protein kinase